MPLAQRRLALLFGQFHFSLMADPPYQQFYNKIAGCARLVKRRINYYRTRSYSDGGLVFLHLPMLSRAPPQVRRSS